MIKHIQCDLLDSPCDIILQCNNCFCIQGGGIALAIRNKFPEVYTEDCKSKKGDRSKLGTCFITTIEKPVNRIKFVIGMYAQYNFGAEKRQVNYEALYRCLEWVKNHVANSNLTIGIPYGMAAGLAGGDWSVIEAMIKSVFGDSPREVLICELP